MEEVVCCPACHQQLGTVQGGRRTARVYRRIRSRGFLQVVCWILQHLLVSICGLVWHRLGLYALLFMLEIAILTFHQTLLYDLT